MKKIGNLIKMFNIQEQNLVWHAFNKISSIYQIKTYVSCCLNLIYSLHPLISCSIVWRFLEINGRIPICRHFHGPTTFRLEISNKTPPIRQKVKIEFNFDQFIRLCFTLAHISKHRHPMHTKSSFVLSSRYFVCAYIV